MRTTKTEQIGARTGRHSRTAVADKDPDFSYAFLRKADVESGKVEQEGWEVAKGNKWHNPFQKETKTKGRSHLVNDDVILCKRSKEASEYFNELANEKKKAQVRLIKASARDFKKAMEQTGYGIKVTDHTTFSQKIGPNMEAEIGKS